MASLVQKELVDNAGRADRGVLQAGFLVLWATKMPSILIELDFICNPNSERYLNSDKGRAQCAQSIFNAFSAYRRKHMRKVQTPANASTE